MPCNRRDFFHAGLLTAAGAIMSSSNGSAKEPDTNLPDAKEPDANANIPIVLHQTDLFRPHHDPDDHFDLALVFGLAAAGYIDLQGIILDSPQGNEPSDPDIVAVAQMNRICATHATGVVGSRFLQKTTDDRLDWAPKQELAAVDFVLDVLRRADRPVRFKSGSSAPDIGVAALREPELFREKCDGIYVNCGSAWPNPDHPNEEECNITLNRAGQAALFNDLPCPVYWFPCWQYTLDWKIGGYSTYFEDRHDVLLADVSPAMRFYMYSMFTKSTDPRWLQGLEAGVPDENWFKVINTQNNGARSLWASASVLMLAGLTVTRDGDIVPTRDVRPEDAIYRLENIHIHADEMGKFNWSFCEEESNRKIFHVLDDKRYSPAMTRALNTVFKKMG